MLKPTEEGTGDLDSFTSARKAFSSLDIIPGRANLHLYEEKIAERWAGIYRGDPLAIRTVTKIREISEKYSVQNNYDYVIVDMAH